MEKQRFFRSQMLFWGNRSLFRAYWCEITETIIIMFSLYYLMTVFMSVNIIYFNLLPTCIFISYFLCSFKFRQKKLTWTYSIDAIVLCYRYKLKQVYIINGNISKITWSPHTLKYNRNYHSWYRNIKCPYALYHPFYPQQKRSRNENY